MSRVPWTNRWQGLDVNPRHSAFGACEPSPELYCLSMPTTTWLVLILGSGVWDNSSIRPYALGEQRRTLLMFPISLDLTQTGQGHSRCLQEGCKMAPQRRVHLIPGICKCYLSGEKGLCRCDSVQILETKRSSGITQMDPTCGSQVSL